MTFTETSLKGAFVVELQLITDERGWFTRSFCKREFEKIGHLKEFVQFNHSSNLKKGTLRGMHYQNAPFGEAKLIRCIKGSIMDVIVDIRMNSPTFLQYYTIELSSKNRRMLYIPQGFAHGFQTLANNTELLYHHTEYYNIHADTGFVYNDNRLDIKWNLPITIISEKDKNLKKINNTFKGI